MKTIVAHPIFYSSIKAGERVYCLNNDKTIVTLVLTENKKWNDKTFKATIVDSTTPSSDPDKHSMRIGRYCHEWCSDAFFTFKDYPCDDDTLTDQSELKLTEDDIEL